MIAVVILLQVFSENVVVAGKLSNFCKFITLRSGEGLTSFNENNSDNFFFIQKYNEAF